MKENFKVWHPNGLIKVNGQTHDGEVDGVWKSYYKSGKLASICISEVGLAVSAQVWTPDGASLSSNRLERGETDFCVNTKITAASTVFANSSQGINRTLPNQSR